jgi:hypothetical protein
VQIIFFKKKKRERERERERSLEREKQGCLEDNEKRRGETLLIILIHGSPSKQGRLKA